MSSIQLFMNFIQYNMDYADIEGEGASAPSPKAPQNHWLHKSYGFFSTHSALKVNDVDTLSHATSVGGCGCVVHWVNWATCYQLVEFSSVEGVLQAFLVFLRVFTCIYVYCLEGERNCSIGLGEHVSNVCWLFVMYYSHPIHAILHTILNTIPKQITLLHNHDQLRGGYF